MEKKFYMVDGKAKEAILRNGGTVEGTYETEYPNDSVLFPQGTVRFLYVNPLGAEFHYFRLPDGTEMRSTEDRHLAINKIDAWAVEVQENE